jgi:hypothetical protein
LAGAPKSRTSAAQLGSFASNSRVGDTKPVTTPNAVPVAPDGVGAGALHEAGAVGADALLRLLKRFGRKVGRLKAFTHFGVQRIDDEERNKPGEYFGDHAIFLQLGCNVENGPTSRQCRAVARGARTSGSA